MEKTVGVLGGGQLGRMLTEAANRLNIKVIILDSEGAPAKQINAHHDHIIGSFRDPKAVRQLAERCDVLTAEIEHVDTHALEDLAAGVEIQPHWSTIRTIQDKFTQKEHLLQNKISVARSIPLEQNTVEQLRRCGSALGFPFMLKSRTEAYDGRGNYPVKSEENLEPALAALKNRPLYAEQWADFSKELAVMVVKFQDEPTKLWLGSTEAFPVVETVHEDSICKLVYAPAREVSDRIMNKAKDLARAAVSSFRGKGIFGVEMFLLENGELLINEIAPRPHNSGHYTIEACPLSQYDVHLRAILGLPIPLESLDFNTPDTNAIMLNILGGSQTDSHLRVADAALLTSGTRIHLYGKGDSRPGRKMGHVTVTSSTMTGAEKLIKPLLDTVDSIRKERIEKTVSQNTEVTRNQTGSPKPLVAVTMGSDSDRRVLGPGIRLLTELKIPHIVTITSAHRTPKRMVEFAEGAAPKGIKVIIAAAGGAAHLPGMIAANTWLPVIGIPVKASTLDGLDSLLSIVQMPRGCPVATVSIDNSENAAQLAVRILSINDAGIRKRLESHLQNQTATVKEKARKMETQGFDNYSADG